MEEIDFEEMRNQITILKTKLEKQEVVNERMMRNIISTKMDPLKRKAKASLICGFIFIVVAPSLFHMHIGTSWAFVIATDMLMIYSVVRQYLFSRSFSDKNLMNDSLLEVAKKLKDFKSKYQRSTLFNVVLLLIWAFWLVLEVFENYDDSTKYYFMSGLAAGSMVGLAIGLYIYHRIQHAASDIIRQIEE